MCPKLYKDIKKKRDYQAEKKNHNTKLSPTDDLAYSVTNLPAYLQQLQPLN